MSCTRTHAAKVLGKPGEVELSDARERAQKIKGAISDGRDPFTEALRVREAWTLRDAMDYFLGAYALRRRLDKGYKRNSENLADNQFPRSWWRRKLHHSRKTRSRRGTTP